MNITVARSVNFGPLKTGLNTVGYTLLNADGSTSQARSTVGITEISAGTGIYGGSINFGVGASVILLWDTGDASPYYATENVDTRTFLGSGGGVAFMAKPQQKVPPPDWWMKANKKMLQGLKVLIDGVTESRSAAADANDTLLREIKYLRQQDIKLLLDRKIDLTPILESIEKLSESISDLKKNKIDFSKVDQNFERVRSLLNLQTKKIDLQNKNLDPIIESLTVLMETERARCILKETTNV